MKIKLTRKEPLFAVKKGWRIDNDYDLYRDIERELFTFPTSEYEYTNEQDYIMLRVTFVRDEPGSDEFVRAYVSIKHNVPSGDHDTSEHINISVEEGTRLCLDEVK